MGGLNEARRAHGLTPLATLREQWLRADRVLILSSRAFDFPATAIPSNVRYVGPAFWEAPDAAPEAVVSGHGPLVLASLSTTYQAAERYLRTLVAALGRLSVRGLVTTGAGYDPASLAPLPANVSVRA
jgi:UDP:flavonoid glycosyltransferase YjiC (YdhE family)